MFPQAITLKNKFSRSNREEGFTLPEIATALLIFGILAAIAIPIFLSQRQGVAKVSLETLLLSASNSVENEREANNGLYSIYTPTDFKETTELNNFKYYYAADQKGYCVEGTRDGKTMYIGTATGGKPSFTSCIGDYKPGGDDPADGGDKPAPPSQASPKIGSLSPSSQVGRDGGQVVTVTGSNFVTGATVLFGNASIKANVANPGVLTFVVPASPIYTKVPVQIINATKRSSNIAEYEFINPIIGTTADPPTPIVVSGLTSNNGTVKATAINCPFSATPKYSFTVTQIGSQTNDNGIAFRDITGRDVATWSAINSFTYTNANQGLQYTMKARAICELEGVTGNASDFTPTKQWTHTIDKPVAPATAPVPSETIVIINTTYKVTLPVYTACPTGTTLKEYRMYQNGSLYGTPGLTTSFTIQAGSVDTTRVYTYSATCKTTWATSPEGFQSGNSSVVRITSKPDTPNPPTGLGVSVGYTQSTAYWNAVSCNFGTPVYRYVWNNGWGATGWSTDTSVVINHAQGTYYLWHVEAKCIYNSNESGVATSQDAAFISPVETPAAPGNVWNDGWGTWYWNGVGCPAGTYPQYWGYQNQYGNEWGTWVAQDWSQNTSSGLPRYTEGYPFTVYVKARCMGPNAASGESGWNGNSWTANLNNYGSEVIHTAASGYQNGGVSAHCPGGSWGVAPYVGGYKQAGRYHFGNWNSWWVEGAQYWGSMAWGAWRIEGWSQCSTNWRTSGQTYGAEGNW